MPFFLLVALQKTPSLLGAECQGVGTTPLHANVRSQTVRFVAVIVLQFIAGDFLQVYCFSSFAGGLSRERTMAPAISENVTVRDCHASISIPI